MKILVLVFAAPMLVLSSQAKAGDARAGMTPGGDTSAPASEAHATPPANDAEWVGHAGAVAGGAFGGLAIGTTFLARDEGFVYGATFEASGFVASRLSAAGAAGLALRGDGGFGADLLAVGGVHHYQGVGRGFLSDDPGASATLPFVGARARAFYRFGKRSRGFQLGLSSVLEQDLAQVSKTYSFTSTPWLDFSGTRSSKSETTTQHIGFTTVGLMLDLGATFEL